MREITGFLFAFILSICDSNRCAFVHRQYIAWYVHYFDAFWFVWVISKLMLNSYVLHCPPRRYHDDVIKWKHLPRYWPFVRGIHRSPVNSPHKGQWRGALMFSLISAWINGWVNNDEAGDLSHRAHYDVIVMISGHSLGLFLWIWCNHVNAPALVRWP